MRVVSVAWTKGRDPDVMVEVFSTETLMEAVLEALLEEPDAMAKALKLFRDAGERVSSQRRSSRQRP